MMKKFVLYNLFFLISSIICYGQIVDVTGTISSPDGFLIVNGLVTATFTPINGTINCAQTKINGVPLGSATNPCIVSGITDNTGTFEIFLTDDHLTFPQGGLWTFSICPPVSAPCQSMQIDIFGTAIDVGNIINNAMQSLTGNAYVLPQFYADTEILSPGLDNAIYYNINTGKIRYYNGSAWSDLTNNSNLPASFYQGGTFNFNQSANGINTIFGQRFTDTSCAGPWIDFRNQANNLDLFTVDCNGIVQTPEIFISGPNPQIAIPIANSGTGTTSALLSKTIGGQIQTAGVGDTAIPVFPTLPSNTVNGTVVCAPGITGSGCVVLMGVTTCLFDASGGTVDHFVGASTTIAGTCKDLGATLPAAHICIVGKLMTSPGGNTNGTILVQPFCY